MVVTLGFGYYLNNYISAKKMVLSEKDSYENIDKIIPFKENSFSQLSPYEKSILEKVSFLYQNKINKGSGDIIINSNKEYYAAKNLHLFYYNNKIAIVSLLIGGCYLYDIKNSTLLDGELYCGRNVPLISDDYFITMAQPEGIFYYKKGATSFEKIEKPFILSKGETFNSRCVVEGLCTADIKIVGSSLIFGIYSINSADEKGVQVNTKLRKVQVQLK